MDMLITAGSGCFGSVVEEDASCWSIIVLPIVGCNAS